MIEEKLFKKLSIFIALGILLVLTVLILRPIATAIIIGLILAYIFYPLYNKLLRIVKKKNISALLVIILVILIIFIPLWFLLPFLIEIDI